MSPAIPAREDDELFPAAHLPLADLTPERPRNGHGPRLQTPRLVAAHPYHDEAEAASTAALFMCTVSG